MAFGKIVSSFTTPLSGRTNRRHFKSHCGDSTVGGPEPREWLLLWLYGMSVGVVVSEDPHLPGGGRFGTTMTRGQQVGGHELGMDRRYGQVMGEKQQHHLTLPAGCPYNQRVTLTDQNPLNLCPPWQTRSMFAPFPIGNRHLSCLIN